MGRPIILAAQAGGLSPEGKVYSIVSFIHSQKSHVLVEQVLGQIESLHSSLWLPGMETSRIWVLRILSGRQTSVFTHTHHTTCQRSVLHIRIQVVFIYYLVILWFELGTLCLLGKHSTTWTKSQPFLLSVSFQIGPCTFVQARLRPQFSYPHLLSSWDCYYMPTLINFCLGWTQSSWVFLLSS
jgi:hypothetical protein